MYFDKLGKVTYQKFSAWVAENHSQLWESWESANYGWTEHCYKQWRKQTIQSYENWFLKSEPDLWADYQLGGYATELDGTSFDTYCEERYDEYYERYVTL